MKVSKHTDITKIDKGEIFTHSPAVCLLIEPDTGIILEANAAATKFYGYSIEELETMAIFDLTVSDKGKVKKFMDSVGANIERPAIFQHKQKNGITRDVQVYASPFRINDRMLLSSVILDVTDSRRAAEELQKSRDCLAMVIEATQASIWEWDIASGTLMFRDQRFKAMMGYKANEIANSHDSWECFCHTEDIPHVRKASAEYMAGRVDRFDAECRVKHKDGTYRWIKSTGKVVFGRDKQPVRWVGSSIDITDIKKIEELQKKYKDILEDFAQVISDVSFIVDEDGIYVAAFGEDEELFPIPKQSIPGLTLFDVWQNEQAIHFLAEIRLTLREQKTRSFKHVINLPKGKRSIITRMSLMNYCVNGKRTVAISSVDITGQEQVKDMLQACYEMRRRSDVLNDLLAGRRSLDEETLAYIKNTGLSFTAPLFCCVINPRQVANGKQGSDFSNLQGVKDEMMDQLNGLQGCIAWGCRGKIGVLCEVSGTALNSKEYSISIARSLQAKIRECYPEIQVMVGVGEVKKGLDGFRKSFQQAWEAIVASRCSIGSNNDVIHFGDVGIFQLLVEKSGCERANEFIGNVIGKLIRQDAEKGTDYLETLEVILQSSNLKEAAKILFLHHNTLVFRKRRIEEILGISINEFETRLTLATAIKLYKLSLLK